LVVVADTFHIKPMLRLARPAVVVWAFCLGAIIGGVLAVGMMLVRGQFRNNLSNTREILGDLFGFGVTRAPDKAAQRRPRMHLLPYGIPLCLGFISYLIFLHGA
jgi:prepilin peptidase CpaA